MLVGRDQGALIDLSKLSANASGTLDPEKVAK